MNSLQLTVLTAVLPTLWGWLVHRFWRRWLTQPRVETTTSAQGSTFSDPHAPMLSSGRPVDYQI